MLRGVWWAVCGGSVRWWFLVVVCAGVTGYVLTPTSCAVPLDDDWELVVVRLTGASSKHLDLIDDLI